MGSIFNFGEEEFLACCGSSKFAAEMASASPFSSFNEAVEAARIIWFNKVDVYGWLEAFAAHPQIGQLSQSSHHTTTGQTSAQWSKGEQSTAFATATRSSLQELSDWNALYRQKFGFVFLICASGRSTGEILAEVKKRYPNRPIVEIEVAAQEQMKITELRLDKLFSSKTNVSSTSEAIEKKAGDRVCIVGGHITPPPISSSGPTSQIPTRTRPPITTHVLDVARGSPATGIEVRLERWVGTQPHPSFAEPESGGWVHEGSSTTDKDGRSGQLTRLVDSATPGIYKISFNTGKYSPSGFFPYVSIVFEIRESQTKEHFHRNRKDEMQAVKEKIQDMSAMRKAKAEAKAEEKEEKEIAKARMGIAKEVRMAKEAEAKMDLHVAKAGDMADKEIAKHAHRDSASNSPNGSTSTTTTTSDDGTASFLSTNTAGAPLPSFHNMK